MISIRALQKSFRAQQGRVDALRSIDLEVAEGEFCVLLGPSGCGKTTTLRCVAGLERPDGGEIEIARQAGQFSGAACLCADGTARAGHGVSILRHLAAHERVPKRRFSFDPRAHALFQERRCRSSRQSAQARSARRPWRAAGDGLERRPAAARGDGPGNGDRAEDTLDG